jgi:hypothetical protein
MHPAVNQIRTETNWPPAAGQLVDFRSAAGVESAILGKVRWGLVWRDYILEDGRVIPEHRISGCPQPQPWRPLSDVSDEERESWEERLLSMAGAGMDPRMRDQSFWAELNQYLAYTYLRYKHAGRPGGQQGSIPNSPTTNIGVER